MVQTSTVGGTSPDHTDFDTWEQATDVSLSEVEQALARAFTDTGSVTYAGASGLSSTVYRQITHDSLDISDILEIGTGNHAYLNHNSDGTTATISEDHFHMGPGLEISPGTGSSNECIRIGADDITVTIDGCLIHSTSIVGDQDGIYAGLVKGIVVNVRNCAFHDFERCAINSQVFSTITGTSLTQTWNIDNCVATGDIGGDIFQPFVIGMTANELDMTQTMNIQNCGLSSTNGSAQTIGERASGQSTPVWNLDDCITDDDPSGFSNVNNYTETNQTDNATFQAGTGGSGTRYMMISLTAGSEDFKLEDNASNAAKEGGADLSGQFTTDALGVTRTVTWDVGPHEVSVASAPTATGALTMLVPTVAGVGHLAYQGTGALTMLVPTVAGVGEVGRKTATGALTMLVPSVAGVGIAGGKIGTGAFAMLVPTTAGVGVVGVKTGTGALTMLVPTVAGVGTVSAAPTATGALTMLVPTVAGVGEAGRKTATGALTMLVPTTVGVGVAFTAITATGALTMLLPTVAGVGSASSVKTATGSLAMLVPTVAGVGSVSGAKTATGALTMLVPTVAGVGSISGKIGTGSLSMLLPTTVGVGQIFTPCTERKFLVDINLNGNGLIQPSPTGAVPVAKIEQLDIDDSFLDFVGTSAADGSRSISSDTTEDAAKFGAIRIEINGVTKWIRVYDGES